ncbi:MAG: hypothetical protein CM1200mP10_29340 [Candidatus Neomarinimicrobiota bacterium]|nr:MAG: hypothetical protein CM1200mP10_29340 [Candidatus Neomarinimicrobiota bacterium]
MKRIVLILTIVSSSIFAEGITDLWLQMGYDPEQPVGEAYINNMIVVIIPFIAKIFYMLEVLRRIRQKICGGLHLWLILKDGRLPQQPCMILGQRNVPVKMIGVVQIMAQFMRIPGRQTGIFKVLLKSRGVRTGTLI